MLAAQLAGHASHAPQQEMLAIFGARDLLASTSAGSKHPASAALHRTTASAANAGGLPAAAYVPTPATPALSAKGGALHGAAQTPEALQRDAHAQASVLLAGGEGGTVADDGRRRLPPSSRRPATSRRRLRPRDTDAPSSTVVYEQPVAGGVPSTRRAPLAQREQRSRSRASV